ncbi:MAG: histidine kinase dimerization/phospho-acceptor domain-containing protein, partial [Candidatus Fermentibacteria bacterium]|nr:histidine kinase dimerization/phospho-acceptor domain-containing protein [Candidatus Fermentibacteria bacterium]
MLLRNDVSPVLKLDESCSIVDCNSVASSFIGLKKEEIKGREISAFINFDSSKIRICKGEKDYFVSQFRHLSGDVSDVVILASHILEHGKKTCFLTIFDVSFDESGPGKARSATIKQLLGGIAHELNNTLTGILGSLSILGENGTPEELREDLLLKAEEGTKRVQDITSKMLAFSRGEVTSFLLSEKIRSGERKQPERKQFTSADESVSGRLLLLDDNTFVSQTTVGMLFALGYSVDTVRDGKSLLDAYRKSMKSRDPYRVVIMDLTIEGGAGGTEIVSDLLKMDPDAVCILSSGFAGSDVMVNYS